MMRRVLATIGLLLLATGCKVHCRQGTTATDAGCVPNADETKGTAEVADKSQSSGEQPAAGSGAGSAATSAGALATMLPENMGGHAGMAAAGSSARHEADRVSGAGAVSSAGSGGTGMAGAAADACGNGIREGKEECDGSDCPSSCPTLKGCVMLVLKGAAATCDAECVSEEITSPKPGDGCCPNGANAGTDADCPKSCGDGIVDVGEACEPTGTSKPCPNSCDDGDSCTTDMLTGSAAQCTAQCVHVLITAAKSGDGCCPANADSTRDADCRPVCGNRIVEFGEKCDGNCPNSCDDRDPCTHDMVSGTAALCNAECTHSPVTEFRNADGCCPSGANKATDADCPTRCGDGVVTHEADWEEFCDTASSMLPCPTAATCEAMGSGCMRGALMGSASNCTARCTMQQITSAVSGDGCCPGGASPSTDSDCKPTSTTMYASCTLSDGVGPPDSTLYGCEGATTCIGYICWPICNLGDTSDSAGHAGYCQGSSPYTFDPTCNTAADCPGQLKRCLPREGTSLNFCVP